MSKLDVFIKNLCGDFNNEEQVAIEAATGKIVHPKAKHINRVCNDKIRNLPQDFDGYFVIEESYYQIGERINILPHLFLFQLNENEQVVLTSYELPEDVKKEEFRNNNEDLIIHYSTLQISEKFNPMIYTEEDEAFIGESVSDFGNGMYFTLKEKTTPTTLEVSEVFEKNGKITFGFVEPIIYKRQP